MNIKYDGYSKWIIWLVMLLTAAVAGCGDGDGGSTAFPPVTSVGAGTGAGGTGKGPAPVTMGTAANYRILAQSAITNIPTSAITGQVGLSPAASSFIAGLTCPEVNGGVGTSVHVATAPSAPLTACSFNDSALLTTAIADKNTAFTDANSRAADYNELGAGSIGGLNLGPAKYKWTTNVSIPSSLMLTGGANDVWIFQTSGTLSISSGVEIILAGGALPENIYWAVTSAADLATTSKFKGTIISATGIAMKTGASIKGRLLAGTAVTLDQNVVGP